MSKAMIFATLFSLAFTFGFAQESGGQMSGGTEDVGNVANSGLILITTRDPSSYIATADGMALYTLIGDDGSVLPCTAQCLEAWPPYTGEASADAGTGLNPDLVATTETEGGQQVTYNDYPLYAFTGDQAPVDVTGQAVEGFGGTWYVVGEDGEPVTESPTTTE